MRDEAVPGTTRYRRSSAEHGAWRQPRVPQAFQPKRRSRFGPRGSSRRPTTCPNAAESGVVSTTAMPSLPCASSAARPTYASRSMEQAVPNRKDSMIRYCGPPHASRTSGPAGTYWPCSRPTARCCYRAYRAASRRYTAAESGLPQASYIDASPEYMTRTSTCVSVV